MVDDVPGLLATTQATRGTSQERIQRSLALF